MPTTEHHSEMPSRTLGSTGEDVSAIGLGGWHLGLRHVHEKLSIRIVRTAIDRGLNFMDNCWDYHEGASEIRMGKALRDGYRNRAFLMTKIDGRSAKEAARQLDESLRRLQTDRVDLIQHHEVLRYEDPDRIFMKKAPTLRSSRPRRPARSATSASRDTRTRQSIYTCCKWQPSTVSNSIPSKCH
jgi:aryl-alcohol dehydrogenase-like predicted oxidoreductase